MILRMLIRESVYVSHGHNVMIEAVSPPLTLLAHCDLSAVHLLVTAIGP